MKTDSPEVIVRAMLESDLESAASVHEVAFPRQYRSLQWLECSLKAYPRILCYTATIDRSLLGYIMWEQKSGFRKDIVLELGQIAVLPEVQGKGIGCQLRCCGR